MASDEANLARARLIAQQAKLVARDANAAFTANESTGSAKQDKKNEKTRAKRVVDAADEAGRTGRQAKGWASKVWGKGGGPSNSKGK